MTYVPLGLSAQAIAGYGDHHPWDPADLLRCIKFCRAHGIDAKDLSRRMAGRSVAWDRLIPAWEELVALLEAEMATSTNDRAPLTYRAMQRVLADGVTCVRCAGAGRGATCLKCKGTGRRGSGRCRAQNCYDGADYCTSCRGRGYQAKEGG